MSQQYFIRRDGAVRGPCDYAKLLDLGKSKKLKASDDLAHSSLGPWVNVKSIVHKLKAGQELVLEQNEPVAAVEVLPDEPEEFVAEDIEEVVEDIGAVEELEEIIDDGDEEVFEAEAVDDDEEDELDFKGPPKLNQLKKQKKKKKKKDREAAARRGPSLGDRFKEIWEVYGLVLKPALIFGSIGFVVLTAYLIMKQVMPPSAANQQVYMMKTTREWMNLEREGKARRQEVLWRDLRWMNLEQVIGLDWEATTDLLEGVADEKTRSLAESALKRYSSTEPGPKPEYVVRYFGHESQHTRLWAARIASRVKPESAEYMIGQLESLKNDSDANVKAAAEESIELLKAVPKS